LEKVGEGRFRGASLAAAPGRVFGGQLVGQAVAAAGANLGHDWAPQSAHAHFLRPGDPHRPLDYRVEDVRDGAASLVRRVTVAQDVDLLTATVSFARPQRGPAHERPSQRCEVPDRDGALAGIDDRTRAWMEGLRSALALEVRFLERPVRDAVLRGERPAPRQRILVRAAGALPDDPLTHAAALAYLSDLFLLSTALLPHGLLMGSPEVRAVTLDHAVWLHGATRADDWVLYTMESPWAGNGRAFCRGEISRLDGGLLASVAQEGTLRLRPEHHF
jgi:acyl-CoA thioesterase-2